MARIAAGALVVLLVVLACALADVKEYDYSGYSAGYSGSAYYPYSGSGDYEEEEVELTTPTPPVTTEPPPEEEPNICLSYPRGECLWLALQGLQNF